MRPPRYPARRECRKYGFREPVRHGGLLDIREGVADCKRVRDVGLTVGALREVRAHFPGLRFGQLPVQERVQQGRVLFMTVHMQPSFLVLLDGSRREKFRAP